jgi:hypothetical protein
MAEAGGALNCNWSVKWKTPVASLHIGVNLNKIFLFILYCFTCY